MSKFIKLVTDLIFSMQTGSPWRQQRQISTKPEGKYCSEYKEINGALAQRIRDHIEKHDFWG